MASEKHSDEARAVWQSQPAETPPTPDVTRRNAEQMEKKMRRDTYGLYAALISSAIVIVGIAALFPNAMLITGASLTLCGFGYLAYEVHQRRRADSAIDQGTTTSVDYQRALLQHRRDFHRKRLWLGVLSLAPGGILFFAGFAAAQPRLAPFIYFQLATFITAIVLIIPLNRRAAMRLQRDIDALDRLR